MSNSPQKSLTELTELAAEAVVWGLPLVLTGRYLQLAVERKFPFNQFLHNLNLATPSLKVVGPNIDTLYGMAWIDLSEGPQVLEVPDTADRYYSIQLMDAYQTTFMYVSRRTTGTKAGAYALTGPGWKGNLPKGIVPLASPTRCVLAVARTLVKGENDLAAARAIQLQYTLGALSAYPAGRIPALAEDNALGMLPPIDLSQAGATYFDELGALLEQYPPSQDDAARLARFSPLGLGSGRKPSLDRELAPLLAAGVVAGVARIRDTKFFVSEVGNGWWINSKVRDYGFADPLMRASVNFLGPAWHLTPEAMYFSTTTASDGRTLTGSGRYVLKFPKGQLPPVDAFWSLTMYGELFSLVENPIDRYVINSFTSGLVTNPDGSLDLLIQHERPAQGASNWLPSPAQGPVMCFMRIYQPRPALLDGSYQLPAIQPA